MRRLYSSTAVLFSAAAEGVSRPRQPTLGPGVLINIFGSRERPGEGRSVSYRQEVTPLSRRPRGVVLEPFLSMPFSCFTAASNLLLRLSLVGCRLPAFYAPLRAGKNEPRPQLVRWNRWRSGYAAARYRCGFCVSSRWQDEAQGTLGLFLRCSCRTVACSAWQTPLADVDCNWAVLVSGYVLLG